MMLLFDGVVQTEPSNKALVIVIGVDRDIDDFAWDFEVDCEQGMIFHNLYTF